MFVWDSTSHWAILHSQSRQTFLRDPNQADAISQALASMELVASVGQTSPEGAQLSPDTVDTWKFAAIF